MKRSVGQAGWAWLLAVGLVALISYGAPRPALAQRGRALQVEVEPTELSLDEVATVKVQVQARHVYLRVPSGGDFGLVSTTDGFGGHTDCFIDPFNQYHVLFGPCVFTFELSPQKEGGVVLPAFSLVADEWTRSPGKEVDSSAPVELRVSKGSGQAKAKKSRGRRVGQPNLQRPAHVVPQDVTEEGGEVAVPSPSDAPMTLVEVDQIERFSKYGMFLLPKFAKRNILINEPFRVDFYIYIANSTQVQTLGVEDLQLPDLEGFRKEELELKRRVPGKIDFEDARVGNRGYQRGLLARYILIPLRAGSTVIRPAEATFHVERLWRGSVAVNVFGPSVQLSVQEALPGAPAEFHSGNVGVFRLIAGETPAAQPAGSWNMLKFEIEGDGNLFSVVPPELPPIPDLETREPHVDRSAVKATLTGIRGKVLVQIPFRVTRAGTWTLPALKLAYLDPATGKYGTTSLPTIKVDATVAEGAPGASAVVSGDNLRGILREGPSEGRGEWIVPVDWVIWFLAVLASAYLVALGVRGIWRAMSQRDPNRRRASKLLRQASLELEEARKQAQKGETRACFAALGKTIPLFLEGRFGFSAGSKTLGELESALVGAGVPPEVAFTVREELESADFGRFAPSALQGQDCAGAVERTAELLGRLRRVRSRSRT